MGGNYYRPDRMDHGPSTGAEERHFFTSVNELVVFSIKAARQIHCPPNQIT